MTGPDIDSILVGMPRDKREAHRAAYRRWADAGYPPIYPLMVRQELARIRMAQTCGVRLELLNADSGVRRIEDEVAVRVWPWVVGAACIVVLVWLLWG